MAFLGPMLWNAVGAVVAAAPKISTAVSIASTVSSVASAVGSFGASRSQANAIESQGQSNQQLAELEALQAEAAARDRERIRRDEVLRAIGTQRAMVGASGVDVNSESPLLVAAESLDNGIADLNAIREQGALQAYAARLGGANSVSYANQVGSATRTQGWTSLLSAGVDIAKSTGLLSNASGVKIA